LPEESEGRWLLEVTQLAAGSAPKELDLFNIYVNEQEGDAIRFAAFYGYLVVQRRNKNFSRFREVLRQYGSHFVRHPMHLSLVAQSHYLGNTAGPALRAALTKAEEALRLMPNNFAVKNQVAEYSALLVRHDGLPVDQLQRAVQLAVQAAAESGYARYYQTVAMLYLETGQFELARESIAVAIDEEPSNSPQYALRITDYNETKIRIDVQESLAVIDAAQREAKSNLTDMRAELLQLLGLFAAIIALLTLTGQIASGQTFSDAFPTLVGASGVIILTFGYVHYAISREKRSASLLLTTAMGLVLLIPAPMLVHLWSK
jgi:tetratricopeptide (TPR) repeat protein